MSDQYKLIYTNSTASIVKQKKLTTKQIRSITLFGGINFDKDTTLMKEQKWPETKISSVETRNNLSELIANQNRGINWVFLQGTLSEVKKALAVFKDLTIKKKMFNGDEATEEQFKALEKDAPSVLHISTHGFYFGSDKKSQKMISRIDDNIKFAHSENPLVRSGLVFAGGNNKFHGIELPANVEDGVLTASEISEMNLFKTRLAVLSACQTGLGEINSDGVYGLQRGFKMAGVDYLIYSLWEVPDYQTQELMVNFYKNWTKGTDVRDAFKKAQEYMKTKYANKKGAIYDWAAFVLKN